MKLRTRNLTDTRKGFMPSTTLYCLLWYFRVLVWKRKLYTSKEQMAVLQARHMISLLELMVETAPFEQLYKQLIHHSVSCPINVVGATNHYEIFLSPRNPVSRKAWGLVVLIAWLVPYPATRAISLHLEPGD